MALSEVDSLMLHEKGFGRKLRYYFNFCLEELKKNSN
jgi:hypothetical protein